MLQFSCLLSRNKLFNYSILYVFKHPTIDVTSSFLGPNIIITRQNTTFKFKKTDFEEKKPNFLDEYLSRHKSNIEWDKLKTQFLESDRNTTPKNVDAVIIKYLASKKYWNQGKDFLHYLEHKGEKLNIGAVTKLLMFYFHYGFENKLDDKDMSLIKQMYRDICSTYTVMDSSVGESCIGALSLTDDWKEGVNIIEKIKSVTTPSQLAYSCLAWTAFLNDDTETGWSTLRSMSRDLVHPKDRVYLTWISNCVSNYKGDKDALLSQLEQIFYYCAENNVNIGKSVAEKVIEVCHTHLDWIGNPVNITYRGVCPACNEKLSPITVTEEDFNDLRTSFLERVLVGRNIFIKSSPQEQQRFFNLLDETGPYDVVLDGLNIAYSMPNRCKPDFLVAVVKKFASENKKILVFGRQHMMKWPKVDMDYVKSNSVLFLVDDLSYDDPFILLASLRSSHTQFLSRDFMRGHKFLLNNEKLRIVFKRWQQKNQMYLKYINTSGKVFVQAPLKYLPVCQKNIGWHVPYNFEDDKVYQDTNALPANWICLRPK